MPFGINIGSALDEVTGRGSGASEGKPFKRNLGFGWHNDSETTVGGDCNPGQENPIVRFKVPAGREYSWGYGMARYEANQGYVTGNLVDDAGNDITGADVIIAQQSSTGRRTEMVTEWEASDLPADQSRDTKEPLPEQEEFDLVTQDSWLVVYLNPDAAVTVDASASELSIPVTEYDLTA